MLLAEWVWHERWLIANSNSTPQKKTTKMNTSAMTVVLFHSDSAETQYVAYNVNVNFSASLLLDLKN